MIKVSMPSNLYIPSDVLWEMMKGFEIVIATYSGHLWKFFNLSGYSDWNDNVIAPEMLNGVKVINFRWVKAKQSCWYGKKVWRDQDFSSSWINTCESRKPFVHNIWNTSSKFCVIFCVLRVIITRNFCDKWNSCTVVSFTISLTKLKANEINGHWQSDHLL